MRDFLNSTLFKSLCVGFSICMIFGLLFYAYAFALAGDKLKNEKID